MEHHNNHRCNFTGLKHSAPCTKQLHFSRRFPHTGSRGRGRRDLPPLFSFFGKKRLNPPYAGDWRICQIEQWDSRYIDWEVPAFIRFDPSGWGDFHFGEIYGYFDYRVGCLDDRYRIAFKWEGADEGDFVMGQGWAEMSEDGLSGHFYINHREDFIFRARRDSAESPLSDSVHNAA
jgi:hypothetical protein